MRSANVDHYVLTSNECSDDVQINNFRAVLSSHRASSTDKVIAFEFDQTCDELSPRIEYLFINMVDRLFRFQFVYK